MIDCDWFSADDLLQWKREYLEALKNVESS